MSSASPEELRTITLSRMLDDHRVVFAGVGTPLVASALACRLHAPQLTVPLQPSGIVPQLSGAGHDERGVQPQTLAVPLPPQLCGAVHAPHVSVMPQPSESMPQFLP